MAQQSEAQKILRIGVIQGGKVIEERLVRKRATVTFGSDSRNTFVLEGSDQKSWVLFELKGNTYNLVFSDDMDGRVSVDGDGASGQNVSFASLKAQNLVSKQGDRYKLPLNDSSRGRVEFAGDLTVLFHFVAAPPVVAKPELPVAAQDGWIKAIEPIFTICLSVSFLIHAFMTVFVFSIEPPPPPSLDDVKALIQRVAPPAVVDTTPPPADNGKGDEPTNAPSKKDDAPAEEEPTEEEPAEEPGEKKPKKSSKQRAAEAAAAAAAKRKKVQEAVAGKGLLAMIGSVGSGGDSSVANVFSSGSSVGELSTDLAGTAGVGAAGSGSGVTRRGSGGGGGSGDAASIGAIGTGGGGKVKTKGKKKAAIKAKVKADDIQGVDGEIDKKGVARVIRGRARAFQGCYEKALKSNSKLRGKLKVEFTIGENGRVIDAAVVKDGLGSAEVARCVLGTLKRLRFPKPTDGEVTITNSFVFQASS